MLNGVTELFVGTAIWAQDIEETDADTTGPRVSSPRVSTPTVSTPPVSTPHVSKPKVSSPKVSAPKVSVPHVSVPHVSKLSVSAPQASKPRVNGDAPARDKGPSPESSEAARVSVGGVFTNTMRPVGDHVPSPDDPGEVRKRVALHAVRKPTCASVRLN